MTSIISIIWILGTLWFVALIWRAAWPYTVREVILSLLASIFWPFTVLLRFAIMVREF